MNKKNWPFIHEWTIYEYLNHKAQLKSLRLRIIYKNNKIIRKDIWKKVDELTPIDGTDFPDIKKIKLEKEQKSRQAEIKFTTSMFNYHNDNKYKGKFKDFIKNNGFIITLSHDDFPKHFEKIKNMEIYEIDRYDFSSFCRENFERLLNKQINQHTGNKVWVMYQGPNFNLEDKNNKPARKSHIWCPTENLTNFDLTKGDRILFIKTTGGSTQEVQNNFDKIKNKWTLTELFIAEVNSKIINRLEYCQLKDISYNKKLWVKDSFNNNKWRFNRVFEFKTIKTIKTPIIFSELINTRAKGFVEAAIDVYCHQYSRELTLEEYRNLIETLLL